MITKEDAEWDLEFGKCGIMIVIDKMNALDAEKKGILEIMDYGFKFDVHFYCKKCGEFNLSRFRTTKPYENGGTEEILCKHCSEYKIVFDFKGWQD